MILFSLAARKSWNTVRYSSVSRHCSLESVTLTQLTIQVRAIYISAWLPGTTLRPNIRINACYCTRVLVPTFSFSRIPFFEASAKTGEHVIEAVHELLKLVLNRMKSSMIQDQGQNYRTGNAAVPPLPREIDARIDTDSARDTETSASTKCSC